MAELKNIGSLLHMPLLLWVATNRAHCEPF
jgi:hypothetical protein